MTELNQETTHAHEPHQPVHGHETHQPAQRLQGSQPQRKQLPPRDPNDRTVYIGKKLAMSYVLAVVTRFNNGDSEVKVKARGRNISVAADVTQIVKNRFITTLKIKHVDITTEELTSDDGRMSRVSSIEITMTK